MICLLEQICFGTCIGQRKLDSGPILQKTLFGWIVAGPLSLNSLQASIINTLPSITKSSLIDESIDTQLKKYRQLEECSTSEKHLSQEELFCEEHYSRTRERDPDGRFIVSIPFKEPVLKIGKSYDLAYNRFIALERKLSKNCDLKLQYSAFNDEYIRLAHMSKIEMPSEDSVVFYLPHHCVLKEDSSTTKLRVVFDGRAITDSGYSLNDIEAVGPNLQDSLFSILMRLSQQNFVMAADVEKMYRQVLIQPPQRTLQCIL